MHWSAEMCTRMGSRLFRGNGHFALVMLSPSASDPPRYQVSELPVPIYSSENRGLNFDTFQLFTDAIIQIDEMTERNDIQLFTECESQKRRSYIDPTDEKILESLYKFSGKRRQLTRLCPAIYQTRKTRKYVIQQFYSATCYNAVILMLLLDKCDINYPRVRQFAEYLASFEGYSSWSHMYQGKSINNFGELVPREYTDFVWIRTENHNLHDSNINELLPMITIITPGGEGSGHYIILDEVTDSGYRIRDPWHGRSLLLNKSWFEENALPGFVENFKVPFARMYTQLGELVGTITPIQTKQSILVITNSSLPKIETPARVVYTLAPPDSSYNASFRFDLHRVTSASLAVVRSMMRPRFSEIYLSHSIFDFADWKEATHLITLLVLLLEPAGNLFIPFGLNRDRLQKACVLASQAAQSAIGTFQNAQPTSAGRSGVFDTLFSSHNNVMEIKRILPESTKDGILQSYDEVSSWLQRVKISPAYMIVGVRPGFDGLYLPELLLEDEHVFTWDESKCESKTHPAANERFLHFDFNTNTGSRSRVLAKQSTAIFDEIMFDWSVLKFVHESMLEPLATQLRYIIKPGGLLLAQYCDGFNFGGVIPVESRVGVEEQMRQSLAHNEKTTQFIRNTLEAIGFSVLIFRRRQFVQSDVFTALMAKNEAYIRTAKYSKMGDSVIVAVKQEHQTAVRKIFTDRFPTGEYSVTGEIKKRGEFNIFTMENIIDEGPKRIKIVSVGNYELKQGSNVLVSIRYSYIYDTETTDQKPCVNLQNITNRTRGTQTPIKGIGMLFVLYTVPLFVAGINEYLADIGRLPDTERNTKRLPDRAPYPFREDIAVYLHADPDGGESLLEYYKVAGFVETDRRPRIMKSVYSKLVFCYLTSNNM